MNSRSTLSNIGNSNSGSGNTSRKSDIQQSRRASAISIPISSLNITLNPTIQPPQPPPPPPRRNTNNNNNNNTSTPTNINNNNQINESKRRNTAITQSHPTSSSSSLKSSNQIINSFLFIIYKQQHVCNLLQKSKSFNLWRREIIYLKESIKTRNERTATASLYHSGNNNNNSNSESSLSFNEPIRKKTTKIGVSLMRRILISMTSRNLTRAWRTWTGYVISSIH